MNKIFNIFLILIVFLLGIQIGTSYVENYSSNDLFEIAKDEFETEIVKPNNNYETKQLAPKKYLPNKIADKISSIFDKLIDKIT